MQNAAQMMNYEADLQMEEADATPNTLPKTTAVDAKLNTPDKVNLMMPTTEAEKSVETTSPNSMITLN